MYPQTRRPRGQPVAALESVQQKDLKTSCGCRGRPTDVYAIGACLYTFVFGRIPFNAPNVFKLFQVVQNEPLRFPDRPQVSPLLQDLLLRMLHKVRCSPMGW